MSIAEQYQGFADRLHKERAELSGRIDALTLFLQRDTSSVVSELHRIMLEAQLSVMHTYKHILSARLKDLGTTFKTTAVASEKEIGIDEYHKTNLDEPVEVGGHDIDRDGPIPFDG